MDQPRTRSVPARTRRDHAVRLGVELRLTPDGPAVACEPVRDADLAEPRAEAWLELALRRGATDVPLAALDLRIVLLHAEGDGRAALGFALELAGADGEPETRAIFGRECLEPVAARAAAALRASGVLPAGQSAYYTLRSLPAAASAESASSGDDVLLDVVESPPPLAVLRARLAPLLGRAERVDLEDGDRRHPVLYTRAALAKAESIARKGARANPPVETGGVLAGPLCSDPDSGELFAVVTDVIEGSGAERAPYSLTFTGATWARVERVMRARRSRPGQGALRLLGSTHGHNFVPLDGEPPCARCKPGACSRTSAFFSPDDEGWTRAVFAQQPWALGHVFGLNALREPVHALFGARGGRIQRRGFHVIDAFTPE